MKVAHLAEAYNLPVTSHGVHDLTVHLLAAVPNKSFLEVHGFGLDKLTGMHSRGIDPLRHNANKNKLAANPLALHIRKVGFNQIFPEVAIGHQLDPHNV